jgi:hypothetical protein
MMKKVLPAILLASTMFSTHTFAANMSQTKMEDIVHSMATKAEGDKGYVKFEYQGVTMLLLSDVTHNRMRIIAPVAAYADLNENHKRAMLESNFHSSLDARYALSDGIVYTAYIHPLHELSEEQVRSAVKQVSALALSFGSEYTSGELSFGNQ